MKNLFYSSTFAVLIATSLYASNSPKIIPDSSSDDATIVVIPPVSPHIGERVANILDERHPNYGCPSPQKRIPTGSKKIPIVDLSKLDHYAALHESYPDAVNDGYFSFNSYKANSQALPLAMLRSLTNPDDDFWFEAEKGKGSFGYKGFKRLPFSPIARFFTNIKEDNPFASQDPFELIVYTVGSGGMRKTEFENARVMCGEGVKKNRIVVVIDPYETNIGSKQFDASAPTPLLNVYSFLNGLYDQGKPRYRISEIYWVSSSVSGMASMGLAPSMSLYQELRKSTFVDLPKLYPIEEIHALHMPAVLQLNDQDLASTGAKLFFYVGNNDEWIKQDATKRYAHRLMRLGHDVTIHEFDGGHDFESLDYEVIDSKNGHRMDEICTVLTKTLDTIKNMQIPVNSEEGARWMRDTTIAKIIGQKADDGTHPDFNIFDWMILLQVRVKQGVKAVASPDQRDRLLKYLVGIGNASHASTTD